MRPFAINGSETLAYTIATGFLGFQVSGIAAGRILATVRFGSRFTWNPAHFHANAPSHGISLSPNDGQLCVLNAPNRYVQVFDVRGRFSSHPLQVANLELADPLPVAFISALRDTPKMLEIDWRGGTPTSTSTRTGPGYLRW